MKTKKIVSGILCVIFLLSTVVVSARTFSDVENDPTVAWAKPYINAMADAGYLKGYEDGTFKPNNTISKTEALILLSRMIGVNDESFADSVELAVDAYDSTLNNFSTNYAKEISYLLYTGVLKPSELDSYISNSNKNTALKRYEAAILLTKLLGAEDEVLGNAFVSSSYADTVEIPDSARAYVEYVKEKGIMQGMGNNEDGEPMFSPKTSVTRSQMAKMLHSLIDIIDLSVQTGVVASTDNVEKTITITIGGNDIVNDVASSTKIKINGKDAGLNEMRVGMHVKITHAAGKVLLIENYATVEDSVIYGIVSTTKDSSGTKSVTITDANDKTKIETYILAADAKVRVNGAVDLFSKLKSGSYVALTMVDGLVDLVDVIDKSATAGGKLVSVNAAGDFTTLVVEDTLGNINTYEVSAEEVQVSRNSLECKLNSLMVGDTVSLKLTYGKVTRINASSKNQSLSGTISYIIHETSGTTLGIKMKDDTNEYKVNKSVNILIDSTEKGTVYDLRPGTDIDFTLQSSEIISLETAATVSKSQINIGTVVSVNPTYGLLIVEEDGVQYNIFINTNTKIIDSVSGKAVALKSIAKGRTVTVTGSNASGVLEASVIVLQ